MFQSDADYTRLSDNEEQNVSWKTFYVVEAGRTNGAHHTIVQELERMGQTQMISPEVCDYLLVFCPVVSRVGTDIAEALEHIPGGKPVILVVMHHTFSPEHTVAKSRRQVDKPNVCLTLDCLFYDGKLLSCDLNDTMRDELWKFLPAPIFKNACYKLIKYLKNPRVWIAFVVVALAVTALTFFILRE